MTVLVKRKRPVLGRLDEPRDRKYPKLPARFFRIPAGAKRLGGGWFSTKKEPWGHLDIVGQIVLDRRHIHAKPKKRKSGSKQ